MVVVCCKIFKGALERTVTVLMETMFDTGSSSMYHANYAPSHPPKLNVSFQQMELFLDWISLTFIQF